jgi:hypothetical protein
MKKRKACFTSVCSSMKVIGKTRNHYEPDIITQDDLLKKFKLGIDAGERIALVRLKSIIQSMLDKK